MKSKQPPEQLVLLGFGAVQKALITLMFEKEPWILQTKSILIIEPLDISTSECYQKLKEKYKQQCKHLKLAVTKDNYQQIFKDNIKNAIVIDLAVRLGTKDVIKQCYLYNCRYINTAIDLWPEEQTNPYPYQSIFDIKQKILEQSALCNKCLQQQIINSQFTNPYKCVACGVNNRIQFNTTILNFGANPGLISHFVKASLYELSKQEKSKNYALIQDNQYNKVAQNLNLTLIQISERDTQESRVKSINCQRTLDERKQQTKQCQMINTWSVMGFLDEAYDRAQISFGTHETKLPVEYDKEYLQKSGQIIFNKLGVQMKTKSFEPFGGSLVGFNIPHAECYSLVQFLRVGNQYRPSSHYSYSPCKDCYQITTYAQNINRFSLNTYIDDRVGKLVLRNDQIDKGYDSLGALMYFRTKDANGKQILKTLWSGTMLDSQTAKKKGSEVNATTIQVAIGTLAAITWMLDPKNIKKGILEPEDLPTKYILNYSRPYLGNVMINYDCSSRYNPDSDQYLDLIQSS